MRTSRVPLVLLLAALSGKCLSFRTATGHARQLQPLKANEGGSADTAYDGLGYADAAQVRIQHGHEAATSLYRRLLQHNPQDTSAATRIAASDQSSEVLSRVGWPYGQLGEGTYYSWEEDIAKLHDVLTSSHYNHRSISEHIFGLPTGIDESDVQSLERYKHAYPFGPTYARPLVAGQSLDPSRLIGGQETISDGNGWLRSLQCLSTMFLLSSCVPKQTFVESVAGGGETLKLLQRLSIILVEDDWVVPLVHLFPMDIPPTRSLSSGHKHEREGKRMVLMTDLHPTVLGMTSLPSWDSEEGESDQDEGAVMYIGPDSLALVHHLHASLPRFIETNEFGQILDVCTGSGVQALATLAMLDSPGINRQPPRAMAVDINERALRFVNLNAQLNGFEGQIITMHADLLSGKAYRSEDSPKAIDIREELLNALDQNDTGAKFDMFLANPPFIPVPSSRSDDPALSIREENSPEGESTPRYGLFSSGGATGEDCLAAIVQMAPSLLKSDRGLLAIVSEFMNPPSSNDGADDELLCKIEEWWGRQRSASARGMLFTNEFAVPAETYALRRAVTNDQEDTKLWEDHLLQSGITSVSPGLLFVQKSLSGGEVLALRHELVPKSKMGSVWTPHNIDAVQFTRDSLTDWLSALVKSYQEGGPQPTL